MARIPHELVQQVQQYARLHRQSISELIRDGLQWRISEGDPSAFLSDRNMGGSQGVLPDEQDMPLDRPMGATSSAGPATTPAPAVSVAVSYTALDAAYLSDTSPDEAIVSDMNGDEDILSDTKAVSLDIVSDTNADADDFDHDKYFLGALCRAGHAWRGTGKSLRRRAAKASQQECLECQRLRTARKRQAAHA
jgi:hypothetical protein